jgi:transcriptional regulator with XRE-family HTH domain
VLEIFSEDTFAVRIALLRKEHGLKQGELGSKIGLTYHSVCKMELGKRLPSYEVLLALADCFDVSVDWIMGRTDKRDVNR